MEEILLLENPPIKMEAIWGDGYLAKKYGYKIADGIDINKTPIGGYFTEDCIIKNGIYKGYTLKYLYENNPNYFGSKNDRRWEIIPVSMACLHASKDLSVQVHPREDWALENLHMHGKSECWYFIDCDEPTEVVLGHNAKSMEELKDYIRKKDWNGLLKKRPVEKGSFYAIKAGTIHAVQKGCTFIEICNPSPITYRFYDYERVDEHGKQRKLDIKLALENILVPDDFINYEKQVRTQGDLKETFLADNENYSAWLYSVNGEGIVDFKKPFAGAYVVEGQGLVNNIEVHEGEVFMITNAVKNIKIEGEMTILCCHG